MMLMMIVLVMMVMRNAWHSQRLQEKEKAATKCFIRWTGTKLKLQKCFSVSTSLSVFDVASKFRLELQDCKRHHVQTCVVALKDCAGAFWL